MAYEKKHGKARKGCIKLKVVKKVPSAEVVKKVRFDARPLPILRMPPELVILVVKLLGLKDQLALNRVNRWFNAIINPIIYANNVKLENASSLFWGAENGQLGTLKHALAAGAYLDTVGPKEPPKPPSPSRTASTDNSDHGSNNSVDGSNDNNEPEDDTGNEDGTDTESRTPASTTEEQAEPWSTPLHLAAKNGHRDIVEWLINQGVDINAPSHKICDCKSLKGARVNGSRQYEYPRWRALHTAMCNDERSVAELLIFRGASLELDAKPGFVHTALHSASSHGLIPIIKLLALEDINLDVNQRDSAENTALHYVAQLWAPRDSPEIRDTITKLLALGADLEAQNETGHTPLLYACHKGNYAVAIKLVSVGANPEPHHNIPSFRGPRPLYYCVLQRSDFFPPDIAPIKHDDFEGYRVMLIRALCEAGADVDARFNERLNERDHRNATALMLACELAEPRVVAALVECGAHVNAQDRQGRTPLQYACTVRTDHRGEVPEIAKILLRRGARLDIEDDSDDSDKWSPLNWAVKQRRWREEGVLESMLSHSTQANVTHGKLMRAMGRCASLGHHRELKALLAFAERAFGVTEAEVGELMDLTMTQADMFNQRETFGVLMDFGKVADSNEALLLRTIKQQNRVLSLAVLERGVTVSDVRIRGGSTLLHIACRWGDADVVKALLDRAAAVDVFDDALRTPLSIAVVEDNATAARQLMREVADPHLVPSEEQLRAMYSGDDNDPDEWRFARRRFLTAFDLAIQEERTEILEDMVARFTLPEIPAGTRFSYVHRASQHLRTDVLKILLQRGADPMGGPQCPERPFEKLLRDMWHDTAVPDVAADSMRVVKMLLSHTSDVAPPAILKEILNYCGPDPAKIILSELARKEFSIEWYTPAPPGAAAGDEEAEQEAGVDRMVVEGEEKERIVVLNLDSEAIESANSPASTQKS